MIAIVKYFLVAICLSTPVFLFSQNFISNAKVWRIGAKIYSEPCCEYRNDAYKFQGDSIINDTTYIKLYKSTDEFLVNWQFFRLWRETSDHKVYQRNAYFGERLLYNFSLIEKDTFETNGIIFNVDSVLTKNWGGKLRKHWYLNPVSGDESHRTVWVEGVGQSNGLINNINGTVGAATFILCFTENGQLVFKNPEYNSCFINSEAPANTTTHDYQTLYSNRIVLFENSEKEIKALRIDSVKVDIDSVFYPFATIQEVSKNCFSPCKASWIGEKVVVKPDGTNLYFNRDGDGITLKTRARINETWIAFQRADNFRVKATVQSIELVNFLGLTDSVKTITLTVIDKSENTLEHPLNRLQLKISKTYGFVQTLNFYLFPDNTVRYPADQLEPYVLVGLTNPKVGVQNLTWFEVNDFQPGDELHVLEHKTGDAYLYLPYREYDNRCIYKYLERTDYADSIVYQYTRRQSIETVYTDSTTLRLFNDTLKSVVKTNPDFDKLPGEPVFETDFAYQTAMLVNEFRIKVDPGQAERFLGPRNCLNTVVGEGCFYEEKYIDGLGGPYYYCSGYVGDKEERKLVYYKKGETKWGEKLVITGVSDIKTRNELLIFPNPAESFITISNPSNIPIKKIELTDLAGRVVQIWNVSEWTGNTMNIQHVLPGIYLLKAEPDAGVKTEKLVVQ